jgi:hypothetical protein
MATKQKTEQNTELDQAIELFAQMGEERMVPASSLFVDPVYQRPLSQPLLKKIAAGFKWLLFARPFIAPRPGDRGAILDGQHRITVARDIFGLDVVVPTLWFPQMDRETEAWVFATLHENRKQLAPVDTFRSKLAAKDEDVTAIYNMCQERGIRIRGIDPGKSSVSQTAAVQSLRRLYGTAPKELERALDFLVAVWRDAPGGLGQWGLLGAWRLFRIYPNLNDARLIRMVKGHPPSEHEQRARSIALATGNSEDERMRAGARVFASWYNSGLRSGRLDPSKLTI